MRILKYLKDILSDEKGGLGIVFASLISSCADKIGDDSSDSVVKIKRAINEKGVEFCNLTNFKFLYSDISFDINTTAYAYSGALYLPTTYKSIVGALLLDGTTRCPLTEVSVSEAYQWANPDDNTGRPDEFCVTRKESGYYEVQFNRKPDNTYTVYFEIELQWTDLSATTDEAIVTKEFYPYLSHFVALQMAIHQGDTEIYQMLNDAWDNPLKPRSSMLNKLLALAGSSSLKKKKVVVNKDRTGTTVPTVKGDYNERG